MILGFICIFCLIAILSAASGYIIYTNTAKLRISIKKKTSKNSISSHLWNWNLWICFHIWLVWRWSKLWSTPPTLWNDWQIVIRTSLSHFLSSAWINYIAWNECDVLEQTSLEKWAKMNCNGRNTMSPTHKDTHTHTSRHILTNAAFTLIQIRGHL